MKDAALNGNPYARFDEGEVASAKSRRGSLLYNKFGVRGTIVLSACVGALTVQGGTQAWAENPVSAEWSTTAMNWANGLPWTQGNAASFGVSSQKEIVVAEQINLTEGITVSENGYRFSGDGSLHYVGDSVGFSFAVPAGIETEVGVPIRMAYGKDFNKTGDGDLVISRSSELFRMAVHAGSVSFRDCELITAKIQNYSEQGTKGNVRLHFDGVILRPWNSNVTLGETGNEFTQVTVGPKGLCFGERPSDGGTEYSILRHMLSPAPGESDGGVKMNATHYALKIESEDCGLTGGFSFIYGTSYLKHAAGIGTGPVNLQASLYATKDMVLGNDMVVGAQGVLGLAEEAKRLDFQPHALTFSDDNPQQTIALSAQNGGGVVHPAFGTASVPVGGWRLSGGVQLLVDGDTLTAAAGGSPTYVTTTEEGGSPLVVGSRGMTFDTNGQNINLGVPLEFTKEYEHRFERLATGDFENAEDVSAWSLTNGKAGACTVRENGTDGFTQGYPNYYTPSSSKFLVVRSGGGSASTTVSAPADGDWSVSFLLATRPGYDTSGKLEFAILLDPGTENERVLRAMSAVGSNHPFVRYVTDAVPMKQGIDHVFKIVTGEAQDVNGYDSLFIDDVGLETKMALPVGRFVKTGTGNMTVSGLQVESEIDVKGGTLTLCGGCFQSNTVNVASGAGLAFRTSRSVVIANPSFEGGPTMPDSGFNATDSADGWTFGSEAAAGDMAAIGKSGTQRNGGIVSNPSPSTTNGVSTAFLRPCAWMETEVVIPADGDYRLSFTHSLRGGSNTFGWGYLLPITVMLDDQTLLEIPAREKGGYGFIPVEQQVTLAKGRHTLRFAVGDGGSVGDVRVATASGPMVFIDDVRLDPVESVFDLVDDGAVWNFASGATIDVGDLDVVLDQVYVDGKRIRGGKSAFRRAGLQVIGAGMLRSGPIPGTYIIIH